MGKKLTDLSSLEVPERRWWSIATDFIVKLPKTKSKFDCIITYVDRLTRRARFTASNESDSAVDMANVLSYLFKYHGMSNSTVSDRDPKFILNYGSDWWNYALSNLKCL